MLEYRDKILKKKKDRMIRLPIRVIALHYPTCVV